MRFDLPNRVVLVTGASSGIGRACAVEYHRAGCRVVAAARSMDRLDALQRELGAERLLPVCMDATVEQQRLAGLDAARQRFGSIDILVNNAAWACFSTLRNLPSSHMERMVRLNLVAPTMLLQAVLPDMIARGSGQIVNISSVVATQPIPRMTFYSATKAALSALSTGLRLELRGTGVDVIDVRPSSTRTAFFDSAETVDVRAVRFAKTQYSAERVARAVVNASRTRRREVTLSLEGKAIAFVRRLSHWLADEVMYQVARRAMPESRKGEES